MTVDELTSSTPPEEIDTDENNLEEADVDADQGDDTENGESVEEDGKQNQDANEEESDDDIYAKAWESEDDFDSAFDRISEEPVQETEEEEEAKEATEPEPRETKSGENESGLLIPNPILKFKGKEVPVSSPEEMIALAQKGLKLEIEMQKIKPKKRMLAMIDSAGISAEEIQALADLKSGKPEAIKYLAKTTGVDVESMFDPYNEEKTNADDYRPQVNEENPLKEFWDEYVKEKPKEAGIVVSTLNDLDETFKAEISNPDIFPKFVEAVELGEFEKAYPYAIKIKASNPSASWLQAYSLAVAQMIQNQGAPVAEKKPDAGSKSTATTIPKSKKAPSRKPREKDVVDKIWADDKYAEEAWQKVF